MSAVLFVFISSRSWWERAKDEIWIRKDSPIYTFQKSKGQNNTERKFPKLQPYMFKETFYIEFKTLKYCVMFRIWGVRWLCWEDIYIMCFHSQPHNPSQVYTAIKGLQKHDSTLSLKCLLNQILPTNFKHMQLSSKTFYFVFQQNNPDLFCTAKLWIMW